MPLPRRPVLLPGAHVVRREPGRLQVGLVAPWRVLLPDDPAVHRVLDQLRTGHRPPRTTDAERDAVAALVAAGLIADADLVDAADDRGAAAAAAAAHGEAAAERLAGRAAWGVRLDVPDDLSARAGRLLAASGLRAAASGEPARAVLLVRDSEPGREVVDGAVRAGLPHLLVTGAVTAYVVGPLVVPGVTACVRCLDAHAAEHDPRRPLVIDQHARAAAVAGTVARDPVLQHLALAWAVRDLVSLADGQRPSTWSATVRIGPDLDPHRQAWSPHPFCGCAWDRLASA